MLRLTAARGFFLHARRRYRLWWLVWLALLLPLQARAWNAAGHRLVAAIAWDQLEEPIRSRLSGLLQAHPDYARWTRRTGGADVDRAAFIEASTWPDDIRKDSRFYDADPDQATALLPGFPDMQRHRDWHFVNRPLDEERPKPLSQEPSLGQLDRRLLTLTLILGAPHIPLAEQAYALPWLIHLVADAHQPLHTVIRRDPAGGLEGEMFVVNPFNTRRRTSTLHAFWDDLPGPPWLDGERLSAACSALTTRYAPPAPSQPEQWIKESQQIARSSAYPTGTDKTPSISSEFLEQSRDIANRRVAEGGYRLADLLRDRLGRPND